MTDTRCKQFLNSKIFLSIVISMFIAVAHFTASVLGNYMHPLQITLQGDGPVFLISILINVITKKPFLPSPNEKMLTIASVVSTTTAITCIVASLTFISPFDSEAVICTNIIFTALFSSLFLKEIIDLFDIVALVLSIIGMYLIVQPSFIFQRAVEKVNTMNRIYGFLFALLASISIASMLISNRKIKNTASETLMVSTFALVFMVSLILTLSFGLLKRPNNVPMILYPMIITVSDLIGQYLLIKIVRVESALTVSIKVLINLPMILLLQLAILRMVPNLLSFSGSILIIISVVSIIFKDKILLRCKLKTDGILFKRLSDEDFVNENSPVLNGTEN